MRIDAFAGRQRPGRPQAARQLEAFARRRRNRSPAPRRQWCCGGSGATSSCRRRRTRRRSIPRLRLPRVPARGTEVAEIATWEERDGARPGRATVESATSLTGRDGARRSRSCAGRLATHLRCGRTGRSIAAWRFSTAAACPSGWCRARRTTTRSPLQGWRYRSRATYRATRRRPESIGLGRQLYELLPPIHRRHDVITRRPVAAARACSRRASALASRAGLGARAVAPLRGSLRRRTRLSPQPRRGPPRPARRGQRDYRRLPLLARWIGWDLAADAPVTVPASRGQVRGDALSAHRHHARLPALGEAPDGMGRPSQRVRAQRVLREQRPLPHGRHVRCRACGRAGRIRGSRALRLRHGHRRARSLRLQRRRHLRAAGDAETAREVEARRIRLRTNLRLFARQHQGRHRDPGHRGDRLAHFGRRPAGEARGTGREGPVAPEIAARREARLERRPPASADHRRPRTGTSSITRSPKAKNHGHWKLLERRA